ncbi:hypothetical protein RRG08_031166 [Elysia crispata]|uniref:Uncharacterized protein n=1 Tax=Elysia crispata TaxID=231223 RepID=A0AAE0ZFI5_9GAST|nr:hypothetical protein RRG08_031166 [Elysia crispata]
MSGYPAVAIHHGRSNWSLIAKLAGELDQGECRSNYPHTLRGINSEGRSVSGIGPGQLDSIHKLLERQPSVIYWVKSRNLLSKLRGGEGDTGYRESPHRLDLTLSCGLNKLQHHNITTPHPLLLVCVHWLAGPTHRLIHTSTHPHTADPTKRPLEGSDCYEMMRIAAQGNCSYVNRDKIVILEERKNDRRKG